MFRSKFWRCVTSAALIVVVAVGSFAGCTGNTDGGSGAEGVINPQFVADGGAGATLSLSVLGPLTVGGTVAFTVTAIDPVGAPLAFTRIFCESERGIAILSPNSGGVAFEHTGPNGVMSGRLGGLLPGSYIMECRGPIGFGLLIRAQVVITGSIPEGFEGFPGAAGGNLGGGTFTDLIPGASEGGVRISSVLVSDALGTSTSGPIDTVQIDCDLNPDAVSLEPFSVTTYNVTIQNDTLEKIFVDAVQFVFTPDGGSTLATSVQDKAVEVPAESSTAISGVLFISESPLILVGSPQGAGTPIPDGTYTVTVTVTATTETGESLTITNMLTLTLEPMLNCTIFDSSEDEEE
jgi:hypothetical protein